MRTAATPTQDFSFVVSHFNSTRQWGKCLNIILKYRYPRGIKTENYLDYRVVRDLVIASAQPSVTIPMKAQWELVNLALVNQLMSEFNISALSSQIQVLSEATSRTDLCLTFRLCRTILTFRSLGTMARL
eukprot:TRINITY_DN34752_c0_g1_i1.p1 TRINITY_DN34752_c0_g1~~TRINITY_DN34752_c0_g1_i1.p1  ORF type:complete len:130 (+),score=14.84 TRINITY_DN34752_c0_g1_i1:204-593(+)